MENNVNSLFRGELQASSSEKRRSKSRTRVWEKVVWFTRRAKGPGKESKNGPDLFNPSPGQERKSKRDIAFELKDQCRETNNTTNAECSSIGKAKQKVRKSRSFNYLRRRKLRQFGDDLSTVVAEENADLQNCDTATGTFNDFKSERRISRQDRCNSSNSLLSEIAKGMNGSQQEVKENFRSILSLPLDELTLNDVPSASQSLCTSPSFPRVRRSVSFSGPAYNSWPRKKRVYLGNPSYDLLSPPLKQKRVSGLRKRATFSGFDSSKLNAQNPYLSLCSGTKSTPHLSHGSQIKNQNGSTIGVIHFYKSPASYQSEGTSGKLYEGDKCSRTREEKTAANIHSRLLVSSCPCNCDKEESSTSCSNSLSAELPRTSEDVSDITVSELESEMRNPSSAGIESGCHDNSLSVCKQACDIDNDVDDTTDCLTFNIKSANGSNSAISAFVVEGGECVNSCIIPHPANLLKEDSTEVKTLLICSGKTMTHIDVADDDNALRTSCKKSQDSVESNSSYANENIAECHNTLGHKVMGIPEFYTGETMTHIDVTDDNALGTSSRKSQDIVESNSSYAKENIAECHYDSTPGHEGMGIPGFYTDLPAPSKHLSNCQNKEHTNEPADCFSIEESQENELVSTETVPADSRLDHNSVEPAHELQASTLPCTLPSVYEMCKSDVVCASQSTHEKGESQLHSQKGKMFWPRKPKINGPQFKQHMEVILQWFGEFNDEQKNIMMRRLLEECELPQMHMLSVAMEPILHKNCPPNCQDMLAWLPHNVTLHVLSFLDPVSLCRCSQINRTWNSLASNPVLWKNLCGHPDWQLSRVGEENERKKYTLQDGTIQWKKMFASRFLLHHNWLKGRCEVRTFEGHTQGISCVQFDDTRIVSGSSDKTIRVWDIQSEDSNAVLTLAGHSGTVRCLNLNGNRLVSGSVDRSIKVWDLSFKSYWSGASCKVTMIGHMHTVRCLQVDDKKVVSGSYDKTLKVWDIKTGHCQLTLRGHNAAVLCVQFDERKIVSGSYDKTIKVWCLVEGSCLMTLMGHHDAVTCLNLTFDSRKVISGSLDHNLKFWDLATGKCIGTLDWIRSEGHTGVIRCLQTDSWRIVSAGDDKTLKMWSLESGQRLLTLRCHTDGVTCLQFNDYSIVSGSYDKTVKFWDFTPAHEFLTPG